MGDGARIREEMPWEGDDRDPRGVGVYTVDRGTPPPAPARAARPTQTIEYCGRSWIETSRLSEVLPWHDEVYTITVSDNGMVYARMFVPSKGANDIGGSVVLVDGDAKAGIYERRGACSFPIPDEGVFLMVVRAVAEKLYARLHTN